MRSSPPSEGRRGEPPLRMATLTRFALELELTVMQMAALMRFALLQREFNRNEVKFGPVGGVADFKVANNCLKAGLWEVMLDQKVEAGNALKFHGWFEFPREEYARIFEALNGRSFATYEKLLAEYPAIDGMAAPLAALRSVASERKATVEALTGETAVRFGEQKRKAKLLLNPNIATYADFAAGGTSRSARPGSPSRDSTTRPRPSPSTWPGSRNRPAPSAERSDWSKEARRPPSSRSRSPTVTGSSSRTETWRPCRPGTRRPTTTRTRSD